VKIYPDPYQEEDPQVEIDFHHGLDERQSREFDGLVAGLVGVNYYSYHFDMANFIKEMKDWLFFRTGDEEFRTEDEKPKPKRTKVFLS
jgi:hypothetical protein